ncbi:hypothetical protein [Phyllobacterium sp. YR531]|uniref:hypothetical protein n=1 Tax=Phyllobacterium sp. YR531 TaxID=1144343 RepID=UPI0002FA1F1E|nr:hypothetical protein [Phyllobacterium sp. YR531]
MFASSIGTNLILVALSVHFFQLNGSALGAAGVYVAQFTPVIIFMPLAWRICDRLPLRTALVSLELVAALLTILVGATVAGGYLWLAYALIFARGFFDMTTKAARNVATKQYALPESIGRANNMISAASYAGQAFGALLGFLLIARQPMMSIASINAVTFVLSAGLCVLLPWRAAIKSAEGGYAALWRRGRDALLSDAALLEAMGYLVATVIILQGFNQVARLWIPLAWLQLPASSGAISEVVGVLGVVSGLAFVSRFLTGTKGLNWNIPTVFFCALVLLCTPFATRSVTVSFLFYFLFMMVFEIIFMMSMNSILTRSKMDDVPCLMVIFYGCAFGGMAISATIIGAAVDQNGLPIVALGLALGGLIFAAAFYRYVSRRRVREMAA